MQAKTSSSSRTCTGSLELVDGATEEYAENERMLAKAVLRLVSCSDVPYFLSGDMQLDTRESEVLKAAIADGSVVDVTLMFAEDGTHPATYTATGTPTEGMTGPGCTRIDAILANPAGAAAVKSVKYEWDLACADHVPIGVTLDARIFSSLIRAPIQPKPIDTTGASNCTQDESDRAFDSAWEVYGTDFEKALEAKDVNAAHNAWCDLAALYLITLSKKAPPTDPAGAPASGRPPVFTTRRLVPRAEGQIYGVASYKINDWDQAVTRCTYLGHLLTKMTEAEAQTISMKCTTICRSQMTADEAQAEDLIRVWNLVKKNPPNRARGDLLLVERKSERSHPHAGERQKH